MKKNEIKIRLTIDVHYNLCETDKLNELKTQLKELLKNDAFYLAGSGRFTGGLNAEVLNWDASTKVIRGKENA